MGPVTAKTDWRVAGRTARAFNPGRNGSTSIAMIQVIPVGLFAGFTCFRRAGTSTKNAAHTGVCIPGTERNAWERNFSRYVRICRLMRVDKQEINLNEEGWR